MAVEEEEPEMQACSQHSDQDQAEVRKSDSHCSDNSPLLMEERSCIAMTDR